MACPLYNSLQNSGEFINASPMNPGVQNALDIINFVKNSNNPQAAMQNLLYRNPQIQQVMRYVNECGGDPKQAFYMLANQRGIDPNQILNMIK